MIIFEVMISNMKVLTAIFSIFDFLAVSLSAQMGEKQVKGEMRHEESYLTRWLQSDLMD